MKKNLLIILSFCFTINYAQKFGNVSQKEVSQTVHPSEPDAQAAILNQVRRSYFEYNKNEGRFELITEVYKKIKVYDENASDIEDISISYYQVSGSREKVSSIKAIAYNIETISSKKVNCGQRMYIQKKELKNG